MDVADIQVHVLQVQSEVEQRWKETGELIEQVCRYALVPSGKMLRPVLLLEACMAVGGDPQQVLPAAIGTEYGHVASLIHDDIIDADDLRRGQTSVHRRYGLTNAILSGDALIFHLFLSLAECQGRQVPPTRIVEALRVVAASGVDLCRGQSLEGELCGDLSCDVPSYLKMVQLKTAAFFRGAAECGAVLGGGSPEQVDLLARYGDHLGIAFQISDDLLAYTSSSEKMGKAASSDIKNKRLTLPVIYTYQQGSQAVRSSLKRIFDSEHPSSEDFFEVARIVQETGALEQARALAGEHAQTAHRLLARLPASPSRERLAFYVELSINRSA